jgi:ATP-binding cassette subfamily B protein
MPVKGHMTFAQVTRRFWPLIRQHRAAIIWSFTASALSSLAAVATPLPLKAIIDGVLQHHRHHHESTIVATMVTQLTPAGAVVALAAVSALLAGTGATLSAIEKIVSARIRERLALTMRLVCLDRILLLTPLCRGGDRSGELGLRLVDDVAQTARLFAKTVPVIGRYLFTTIFTLIAMAWIDPILGGIGLAVTLLLAVMMRRAARPLMVTARAKRKVEGKVAGFAQEVLAGLPFIQAAAGESSVRDEFSGVNRRSLAAGVEETRSAVKLEQQMQIANGIAVALLVGGGGLLALSGRLSIGDLTLTILYLTQLLKPVEKINEVASAVSGGQTRAQRLIELLDRPVRLNDTGRHEPATSQGRIVIEDVSFAYPTDGGPQQFVFGDLVVEPGSFIVIEGPSGAGKSTLLALLSRLFDPDGGRLLLDGVPYTEWTVSALRRQFAVSPQVPALFAGTVREAMQFGCDPVEDSSIWKALESVALAATFRGREELDTRLNEAGGNLSGGQRARLSLARALLANRPILLLDEPFANIDPRSRDVIAQALEAEKGRRTIILVSHHALPSGLAERHLIIEDGRLSEPAQRRAVRMAL